MDLRDEHGAFGPSVAPATFPVSSGQEIAPRKNQAARALLSQYIADRRAGPLTTEAIKRKHPEIDAQEILALLQSAYAEGRIVCLNHTGAIMRCHRKLQMLGAVSDDMYDKTITERQQQRIRDLESQLKRLERLQGQFKRKPKVPDRPQTLIEFIATEGGIRIQGKKRSRTQPTSQAFLPLFGPASESADSLGRDSDAAELRSFIDGGPTLISVYGSLAGPSGRLSFDRAAEAALQAGYYDSLDEGNGVCHSSFRDLLQQDYIAWRNRSWSERVFSISETSAALDFMEMLHHARGVDEAIGRFGMPLMGEDCPQWRHHIRRLNSLTETKGITRDHLNYVAYRLGFHPEDTEQMSTRDLTCHIRSALDDNGDERPIRTVATLWVMESAFPGKAKKYEKLLASEANARRATQGAAQDPCWDVPFDAEELEAIKPIHKGGKGKAVAPHRAPLSDDCPF